MRRKLTFTLRLKYKWWINAILSHIILFQTVNLHDILRNLFMPIKQFDSLLFLSVKVKAKIMFVDTILLAGHFPAQRIANYLFINLPICLVRLGSRGVKTMSDAFDCNLS